MNPLMNRKALLVAALALLAAGGGGAACGDAGGPSGRVRTQVLLTDSPFPYDVVSRVDVHIVRIAASTVADTADPDYEGSWFTVAEPRRTVNLLELQQGATTILGESELPAEQIAAVRLTLDTRLSSVRKSDGSLMAVNWQGEGEQTLHALVPHAFALWAPGTERHIVIDFDVGRSFVPAGEDGLTFIPWIRAVVDIETGAITGTVRAPSIEGEMVTVENASIEVMHDQSQHPGTNWVVASSRSDGNGRYRVAFLSAGTYQLLVQSRATGTCILIPGIEVPMGQSVTRDAELPQVGIECQWGAPVDSNAVHFRPAREGTFVITATSEGKSGSATVSVK